MQYLCPKIGKFRSLFEADDLDAARIGADARVGRLHAVHVGPDLDAFSAQAGADQRGGEVRTAAANRGMSALAGCADEAAHDGHTALLDQRLNSRLQTVVYLTRLGHGAAVLRVGDDDQSRIYQCCWNIAREKCRKIG